MCLNPFENCEVVKKKNITIKTSETRPKKGVKSRGRVVKGVLKWARGQVESVWLSSPIFLMEEKKWI